MSELSQLRWQCRRGVKELDVILSRYLEQYYMTADEGEKQQFKALLLLEDPMLTTLLFSQIKRENKIEDIDDILLQKLGVSHD